MLKELKHFEMNNLQQNIANILLLATFSDIIQLTGFIRDRLLVFLLANSRYHFQGTRQLITVPKKKSLTQQPIQNILNPKIYTVQYCFKIYFIFVLVSTIYRTIILPVVLYGCEAWSLTLREERKLRVFQNMVLRRIFGPRREEVTGEWRKLHNEELNDLYCSPNIVRVIKWRRMRWAGHVARMGE